MCFILKTISLFNNKLQTFRKLYSILSYCLFTIYEFSETLQIVNILYCHTNLLMQSIFNTIF